MIDKEKIRSSLICSYVCHNKNKTKKNIIKAIDKLLFDKNTKSYLIPKNDLNILNVRITEYIQVNSLNEQTKLYDDLTDLIYKYCLAIIREQNIITTLYK